MKASLRKRIRIANEYIQWAINNPLEEYWDSFGSGWPTLMTFEKPISISRKENVVTVRWLDGYDQRPYVGKFKMSSEDDIYDLRLTMSGIIRSIKRVQKRQ